MSASSHTQIKICGLNSIAAVDAAVAAGADYLGFIHFPKSPRHVSLAQMRELAARKGAAKSVAVLVDPDEALMGEVLRAMRPDYIQLHGGESPMRCLDARLPGKPSGRRRRCGIDGAGHVLLCLAQPLPR